jgi:hypothetical protein
MLKIRFGALTPGKEENGLLQPEEENPFENHASQTAQCKKRGKQL